MAKNYEKPLLLETLDHLNNAFHLGFFSIEEKNELLKVMTTRQLSGEQRSMLHKKIMVHPDQEDLLMVLDYFKKGEVLC